MLPANALAARRALIVETEAGAAGEAIAGALRGAGAEVRRSADVRDQPLERIDIMILVLRPDACGGDCPGEQAWRTAGEHGMEFVYGAVTAYGRARLGAAHGGVIQIVAPCAANGSAPAMTTAAQVAGVRALVRSAAVEWADADLRLNLLSVPQELWTDAAAAPAQRQLAAAAAAAAYLCSDYAAYFTGGELCIGAPVGRDEAEHPR